jgi:hypothetical protein
MNDLLADLVALRDRREEELSEIAERLYRRIVHLKALRPPEPLQHPTEEGLRIKVNFDDLRSYWERNPIFSSILPPSWPFKVLTVHRHVEGCRPKCRRDIDASREATPEEVVGALAKALRENCVELRNELERFRAIDQALPSADDVKKIRRRLEDRLRKSPAGTIIAVAKLLDLI